jgi:hypothetical protein
MKKLVEIEWNEKNCSCQERVSCYYCDRHFDKTRILESIIEDELDTENLIYKIRELLDYEISFEDVYSNLDYYKKELKLLYDELQLI